ncbi:MAG: glycerol kinase GlpK [Gammaproteobacteria bacterium]|nr:glycerol kinase GlpK [Gammaproteobacteria bacterium]MCH9744032.1 glycerol kinase GlpK [Gammaproteobacteria bacterium]
MFEKKYILAIDQGTTSSRAIVFDLKGKSCGVGQHEFTQVFPQSGWVEHDPEIIWKTTVASCREAIKAANIKASEIAALGISNQRETTILWDKQTGKPIYNAIVWQDRRTQDFCCEHASQYESLLQQKTGLLLDPYFSATKIAWILENVQGVRQLADKNQLAFGTVDSFLLWHLTGGKIHATDITNASRTLLYNIHEQCWDDELLALFKIPQSILPEVRDCDARFGVTDRVLFDAEIPICGVAGDQQAALIGQACFQEGMIKSTYGTGCFLMLNTGAKPLESTSRLLTTISYRIKNKTHYALEGSIFNAGTSIKWLRDYLHLIESSKQTEMLAKEIEDTGGVYFVPTFTGVGAPYWNANARGAILGLTRDTSIAQIVRAALESVCYRTRDLIQAIAQDYRGEIATLRTDGGMCVNDWMMQFLADMLSVDVQRAQCLESSALGVAYLAGLGVGIYASLDEVQALWQSEKQFTSSMGAQQCNDLYAGWQDAIERIVK